MTDSFTPGGNPVCSECGRWNCSCKVIHHSANMSEEDARLFAEYLDWLHERNRTAPVTDRENT
jgi:hypothetical protein